MTMRLSIVRPDDWHVHLRDGAMLRSTLPATAELFGRAIVMPNLVPPVRRLDELRAYRGRIIAALTEGHPFVPLMTIYLTETTDPAEILAGAESGELAAVKLYPAGATTNSDGGVVDFRSIDSVLKVMQTAGVPLLIHAEVAYPEVDIFDREKVFIDTVLEQLRRRFPELRIVLEHATTREAVDYVRAAENNLAATLTPHHLMINRNAIFRGGIRPHFYCLPIAKREEHRLALREAATSGDPRFFLGTDSAPHAARLKENACGCAGIFNAPVALPCIAQVFEEEGALDRLERFASLNGASFYRVKPNADRIVLAREAPQDYGWLSVGGEDRDRIRIFQPERGIRWRVIEGKRHT